jgi:hypothetical protein
VDHVSPEHRCGIQHLFFRLRVQRELVGKLFVPSRSFSACGVPQPIHSEANPLVAGERISIPPLPPATPGDPVEWVKGVAVFERVLPLAPPAAATSSKSKPARPVGVASSRKPRHAVTRG